MADIIRFFVDTSYVLGIYNKGDQFHRVCVEAMPLAQKAQNLYTTDAVLMEIGNTFSAIQRRKQGSRIIRDFLASPQVIVEHLTPEYFEDALSLYEERTDKQWGMVDCFSFVIMRKFKLKACLGTDHHFVQAGFKNLPF